MIFVCKNGHEIDTDYHEWPEKEVVCGLCGEFAEPKET